MGYLNLWVPILCVEVCSLVLLSLTLESCYSDKYGDGLPTKWAIAFGIIAACYVGCLVWAVIGIFNAVGLYTAIIYAGLKVTGGIAMITVFAGHCGLD
jgi:hypothetical protein